MATIHISRDEAAGEFDSLVARAKNGDEIVIEENSSPVAVIKSAMPKPKLLSEILRRLEERGSTITLDDEFGRDLTEAIEAHQHETLLDPWESS